MAGKDTKPGDPIVIKKYANRRLYNTQSSSYITLDDLARMTRDGVEFEVKDAKSGDDITRSILTQIIMEAESGGAPMLPISFLRQIIGLYGNSMQAMMPTYLESAMQTFRDNQAKWQEAARSSSGSNLFARMHEANMAMMRAATEAFVPGSNNAGSVPMREEDASPRPAASEKDELAALREEMAAMQKKIDKLGK